jgi:hypothetical protein
MFMTYDPYGMLGGLMIIYLVVVVVFCLLGLALAIWVYKDAKKRDMNAAVWLLIVLVTGFIGCIIYLVVRD